MLGIFKGMEKYMKKITTRLLVLLLAIAICCSLTSCYDFDTSGGGGGGGGGASHSHGGKGNKKDTLSEVVAEGDLQIHFIELGNKYTGDCTYIKAGEHDILIDAGSRTSSVETINEYLDEYVTDRKLEYVIVTHAHQDHYAGFATSQKKDSLFDLYECEVIIDFAQITSGKEEGAQYKNYIRERDDEIAKGAKHYTAAEAVEMGGEFDLGKGITLTVLDSYYYYNRAKDENDHSVCTLIDDGKNSYLFTGDLEAEGEEKLVEMNDLPEVKLYKAGHHGSKTSSSDVLLSVIKPEIVCVCCCAGSPEYTDKNANQFPTQAFVDRVAPYTDKVYVTTLCVDYEKGEFTSMNGNIVVYSVAGNVTLAFSANDTKLKDTAWFKKNRTTPAAWQSAQ